MVKLASLGGKPASEKRIPIAKPVFDEKTVKEVSEVLRSGYVRQGPKTKEFEEKFAEAVGAKHAYAVSNGTAALHVSYLSVLKPGDEIIVPSFTFFATASMAFHSRAKPVFADIDPETFIIDPEDVKGKITRKTKAVVPVHLFGNAANMDALNDMAEDHGFAIISDSAQAHGTEYDGRDVGSFDTLNCYSFYPTKTLTTGEGGIVTTNDDELYKLGCLLRSHGDDARYHHVIVGLNYRLTDIAAVIGLNQLSHMKEYLERRRHFGAKYKKGMAKIEGIRPQRVEDKVNHSYSYFSSVLDLDMFRCGRDEFLEALRAENIDCAVHYPIPLNRQPAITDLLEPEDCPVSEDVAKRIFSLPMHPELTDKDLENVLAGVEKVVSHYLK
ncbi:DegT/DnrJ/EryC1/StrS family aminotransferase [Candidatus Bathyarchaeota archaeon]|nr:MAG: DegT/DnrJ/EryC1/StrS family aminotransferase [Candidatus Bathyarchaeota archaeon]